MLNDFFISDGITEKKEINKKTSFRKENNWYSCHYFKKWFTDDTKKLRNQGKSKDGEKETYMLNAWIYNI